MPIRFPQEAGLRDARRLLIRPFTPNDTAAVWQFFQRLPFEIKRYAWDRIDQRALVESWAYNLDYSKAMPLLAIDGTKIVADATLHYRDTGPLRLVGRVKWLIDPAYRGAGLGTILVNLFIQMAEENGLRHLTCMLIKDLESDAVTTLRGLGFSEYTIPGYGTDPDGNQKDMVLMVLHL
ncbi:MAG: GNAT family N-acetyltransferase [Planctomycetes bacterium]|nr:GNAT family N-acetyltransferase [Planctomycetota bacterium]